MIIPNFPNLPNELSNVNILHCYAESENGSHKNILSVVKPPIMTRAVSRLAVKIQQWVL